MALDLTGQTFGHLTVTHQCESTPAGARQWVCRCVCGNTCVARVDKLTKGLKTSCGCATPSYARDTADLTGRDFRRLFVTGLGEPDKHGNRRWRCDCACGKTGVLVTTHKLLTGKRVSCGCAGQVQPGSGEDLTGKRFGQLTALKLADSDANGNRRWQCLCDCGTEVPVRGALLRTGKAKSCGCMRTAAGRKRAAERAFKTGRAITIELYRGDFCGFEFGWAVAWLPLPEGHQTGDTRPMVYIKPMPRKRIKGRVGVTLKRMMHELKTRGLVPDQGDLRYGEWMQVCNVFAKAKMRSTSDETIREAFNRWAAIYAPEALERKVAAS